MTGSDAALQNGTGTEIAPLAFDGLSNFSARDLALPKLYKADYTTKAVKKGLVKAGSLFIATDPEDEDPVVLSDGGKPVTFHVLALRWGKSDDSETPDNPKGELRTFAYDDPAAPQTAWTTYTYAILVPDYDPEIPCTLLLTKSSRGGAQKINTVAQRLKDQAPLYTQAFTLTTAERHNEQGDWYIYRVSQSEADDKNVEAAAALYGQIAEGFARQQAVRVTAEVVDAGPAI